MLTIKTLRDIHRIRKENLLPQAVMDEIEQYFRDLTENLTGEEDAYLTYNLEMDGPILVLQANIDDPYDLPCYGMTKEYGGLFSVPIEFTSRVKIGNTDWFKTYILLDNDFCLILYSEVGRFGEEFDQYLSDYQED